LNIWDVSNRSNWSPIEVGAVLSTGSVASTCCRSICWTTLDAMRATPALLAFGPALHPVCEGRIAVVLCSRNFCILPTTLAMLYAAPLLLLGRPLRRPISLSISAIERIYRTSDRLGSWLRKWARNEAPRTTTHGLVLRPMVLVCIPVTQAFVGRGPEEVAEQPQGQQQASECRKDEEPTHIAAASSVLATITDILHCWLHRKLAPALADIHQIRPIPAPRVTGLCRAIHHCRSCGRAHFDVSALVLEK